MLVGYVVGSKCYDLISCEHYLHFTRPNLVYPRGKSSCSIGRLIYPRDSNHDLRCSQQEGPFLDCRPSWLHVPVPSRTTSIYRFAVGALPNFMHLYLLFRSIWAAYCLIQATFKIKKKLWNPQRIHGGQRTAHLQKESFSSLSFITSNSRKSTEPLC